MNKKPALIAAFLTTAVMALVILMVGFSAYFSPTSAVSAASPAAATDSNTALVSTNDQVSQLRALVSQYQAREQQYQSQLNQLTSQNQQYAQILTALQQRRIITIDQNGQISIPRTRGN